MNTFKENIECPNCHDCQLATIIESLPWWTYIHTCTSCNYLITESDWHTVAKITDTLWIKIS